MPRRATDEEEQKAEVEAMTAFRPVDIQTMSPVVPVLQAHVVYMGGNPKKSASLPGRVYIERRELREGGVQIRVTLSDEGIEHYDFASEDINGDRIADKDGKEIPGKYVPASYAPAYGAQCVGRPMRLLRHAEHIRLFMRMKDEGGQLEFKVFVHPDYHTQFVNYCNRKERRMQATESEYRETAGLAAA